ncbi:MAG TPA: efflux RND transporter permease subunit [Asanoa sp.]
MTRWIVGSSLRYGRLVLALAVAVLAVGLVQLRSSTMETLPEFTPTRVEVQTESLGMSAEEVEQLITSPMENEFFNGIPWLAGLESRSIPGLSSIEMTFQPGTDMIKARQVVQERLTMVPALPAAASRPPMVIQPLSSTSRVMMIGLSSKDVSLIDMSVLARWTIGPRLMGIPGVANVAVWGFRDRQLQVQVDPVRLTARGVVLDQVLRTAANALWVSPLTFVEASTPGTGGFVDTANQRIEVQHNQPIRTAQDLAKVTVEGAENKSLLLGDVARIVEDHQPLIGDGAVQDAPSLMLVVERFPGASVSKVTSAVEDAIDAMRPGLGGIDIDTTIYRPATFVDTMAAHLTTTLVLGAVLLVLLLGAVLIDWRAALVGILTIAVSTAATFAVLSLLGVGLNMMTVAGLVMALVIVVDDAVVAVDHARRRLRQGRPGGSGVGGVLAAAVVEMRGPLLVATVVTAVCVAPIFVLDGVTGAFLRPLAVAYLVAIGVSMAVALTVGPVLGALLLPRAPDRESSVAGRLAAGYVALLARLIRRPAWAAATATLLAVAGLVVLPVIGARPTTPTLQDRQLLVHWEGAPGTSLPEMNRITNAASAELRALPGVRNVGGQVGRAISSDQIVSANSAEIWVGLDAKADYDTALAAVRRVVDGYPGLRHDVTTYSDQRIRQVVGGGVAEDLVVRLYGNDYGVLEAKADEVRQIMSRVDGVVEPRVKTEGASPTVEIEVSVAKAAAHGLKPGDIRRSAATLVSGTIAGSLFQDQKVFDVVVWGVPEVRRNLSSINDLLIDAPSGGLVRLGDVADVRIRPSPQVITHDQVSRSVDVVADVDGRSLGSVTGEVEDLLGAVMFPREHHLEVLHESGARRGSGLILAFYVGAAAILAYFLLQAGLGSWRLASLLFLLAPIAVAGGVLAAAAQPHRMSVVALMALLAVLAVAVRGALLQVAQYRRLEREAGASPGPELVLIAALERFVPTVTTALGAGLALAPLVVYGSVTGLEVVSPLALVVVAGLVSATLVNLFVVPPLCARLAAPAGRESTKEHPDATR